jgi:deoxyadenosine/deoxycytidine kinase
MAKHLILVAGNIGAGKTSLTERLGERLGWRTGYESVADNPYLSDFYADMAEWSFHLQIFFLGSRAEQYLKAAAAPESAIMDRSIYEDFHIFSRALRASEQMNARDYDAYRRVYELVTGRLPVPDLLLYLRCPVPVLLERIRARGREMEKGITAEYLELLDSYYREWVTGVDICPVLTIPSDDLDFVNRASHLDIVIERINHRLAGRDEVVFPEG